MNAGGYRVSPLEVEAALAGHPAVAEVAAAEHRGARRGPHHRRLGGAETRRHRRRDAGDGDPRRRAPKTLAAYKRPREVFFVDALPRTPNGKVARRLLGPLGAEPALGRVPRPETAVAEAAKT